jgi:flagellar hook-basal body complex protein FliE
MTPLMAAKAYAQIQGGLTPPKAVSNTSDGPDFSQLVQNAMKEVTTNSQKAEHQMIAQTQGKADMVDVVTAVSSAQSSLTTMMAVRDQVISAYQSIMSMPV